jgi:capsular polysaccharide transport system permease protein
MRFKTARSILALILREMATTYGRSPGGYLWAVLEPVAGTALLTFVFSLAFRAPPIGDSFPLFYATGLLPFMLYLDVSTKVSQAIQFSRPLLFYPTVTYFDAIAARFILNFITQIMVFFLVITGIIIFFDVQAIVDFQSIVFSLLMAGALGLGVGALNCFLISMFPIWVRIWAIFNRPLFVISCIIFVYEAIPEPYRGFLWYNPLVHIIGMMRHAFYPTYDAIYVSSVFVLSISGILFLVAFVFLNRYHRDILNN